MHRLKILPWALQNEATVPTSALLTSGAGAEAYVPAARGVQYRARAEVYEETYRYADIHHDQGMCKTQYKFSTVDWMDLYLVSELFHELAAVYSEEWEIFTKKVL